ncbi:MAG: hypothetical protein IT347_11730 [Candidatus Eisenbacteria bacterium]|nr:hypothetical protein [Candidatus Eisenbacteria bacterium]
MTVQVPKQLAKEFDSPASRVCAQGWERQGNAVHERAGGVHAGASPLRETGDDPLNLVLPAM